MELQVKINPILLSSITSFINVRGYLKDSQKDVYFLGYFGISSKQKYKEELSNLISNNEIFYIDILNNNFNYDDIERYSNIYIQMNSLNELNNLFLFNDEILNKTFLKSFRKILFIYSKEKQGNSTLVKNYAIKLMGYIEYYFPKIFCEKNIRKIVYSGKIGEQEYLFLYLLVLLGKDVIYLNPEKKLTLLSEELLKSSHIIVEKNKLDEGIDELLKCQEYKKRKVELLQKTYPERNLKGEKKEKEYEELAKLAESVVMISVYDSNNNCIKTGSGVIFTKNGYILTNFHVISGGAYYEIILENRVERSYTSTIVKYSDFYDLAIIRIEPSEKYIPILKPKVENKLVRGQKVVAIGSPLGLFNSVSDGIISGFRVIRDVEMVQFTAPISSGSSGGVLLNRYGQMIGLITAGFSEGQNINLAVSYEIVYNFIKNFLQGDE